MKKYLSKVVYGGDFLYSEARSSNRQQIIDRHKKLTRSKLPVISWRQSDLISSNFIPEITGPPTEKINAYNLFSIAYWDIAQKQLPRKSRSDTVRNRKTASF